MSSQTSNFVPRYLPTRLPRVCVAVVGSNPAELLDKADSVVRDNPFIELRLDYLARPALVFPRLRAFVEYHPEALLIATCRRVQNGGRFRGSVASEVDILVKAAANGCQLLDLELQSARTLKPSDFHRIRRGASLIVSAHDFRATRKLEETFQAIRALPADFIKIVATATSLHDNVAMMKFLEQKSDRHSVIGVCMGEQGIISRILSVRAGSAFVFAAANPGEETAPGQVAARTLHDTFRIDHVDTATRVYGVAGDPVSHSLSPLMINTAFRRENVNAVYLPLHAKKLQDLMACVRDIPIHGLSVTMPYKQEILKYLDNTDAVTARIGACNTVIRAQDGNLYGFNTDVAGVIRPLEQRISLNGAKILVLGAGGAARAAVFGLKERGAEVYVMNRTASAAQRLAKQARARFLAKSNLKKFTFDVIINATPVGMNGKAQQLPLSEKDLRTRYYFEMVYSPAETRMSKAARERGIHVISGVEMFVQQGARQFEIWTGKPAPVEEMQRVVVHALESRATASAAPGSRKKR